MTTIAAEEQRQREERAKAIEATVGDIHLEDTAELLIAVYDAGERDGKAMAK